MISALETVSDYIADARVLLQDLIPSYRYDDPSLLTAFNVTLLEARRMRADLFIYTESGRVPYYAAVSGQRVPLEESLRLPMVYGLVGHALARDQDDYQDARSGSFLQLFKVALVGDVPSPAVPIQGGGR